MGPEPIKGLSVKRYMVKFAHKSVFFRSVTALAVVFLFGVLLLPTVAGSQQADCDDDCDDHCESVCGCISCLPTTLAYVIPLRDNTPVLNVQAYSMFTPSIDIEYEFLDRVDRPPQILL
jgi:hypothetical protein